MKQTLVKTSKFLSLVLRHRPEAIGLRLDEQGWAAIDQLLTKANQAHHPLTRAQLIEVVTCNDKQRFALSEDGQRIRANQGHSVSVDLALSALMPPALLYHGTPEKNVASILQSGLHKAKRHHVHLSADIATATKVGSRRGKPVVFTVLAKKMHEQGCLFYQSANGVWLVDAVPAAFISFEK